MKLTQNKKKTKPETYKQSSPNTMGTNCRSPLPSGEAEPLMHLSHTLLHPVKGNLSRVQARTEHNGGRYSSSGGLRAWHKALRMNEDCQVK